MRPVAGTLQRQADQKAREAKEYLDAQFAEIFAQARHFRFRQSREIEMMAEQHAACREEADEVVAVLAAQIRRRGQALIMPDGDFRGAMQDLLSRSGGKCRRTIRLYSSHSQSADGIIFRGGIADAAPQPLSFRRPV